MRAIRTTVILAFGLMTQNLSATIVPFADDVVETVLQSQNESHYLEGYVQLNKGAKTMSLVLQPVMPPCPADHVCSEVMPAPVTYVLEQVQARVDDCDAKIYRAEQTLEHSIKVTVVDNTQYNFERCPTFIPLPETTLRFEKTMLQDSGETHQEEVFAGPQLSKVRY